MAHVPKGKPHSRCRSCGYLAAPEGEAVGKDNSGTLVVVFCCGDNCHLKCPQCRGFMDELVEMTADPVRLFVDDFYDAPEGWTVARTSEEAIALLNKGNVVECTLDHDLGDDDTGYRVVCWMEEHDIWPVDGVRCHSSNGPGIQRIELALKRRRNATDI